MRPDIPQLQLKHLIQKAADFALDVPHNIKADKRWCVLPGAPVAYITKEFEHFHPSQDIAGWIDKYGNFAPSVRENVVSDLNSHQEIAGFMSVPLYRASIEFKPQNEREVVGVLNIHWSAANVLAVPDAALKFSNTIYPLCLLLSELMCEIIPQGYPTPTATQLSLVPAVQDGGDDPSA